MNSNIELRTIRGLSVREASPGSGYIGSLSGYAAVFNSDSLEFDGLDKPWVERIAPGAFKRTLVEQPDVKALWSHKDDAILARTPKSLKLTEDTRGLKVEINLINTSQNRDVLVTVRAGIIDAMSFGFKARSAEWKKEKDREVRTLLDVDLYEVSPVAWPAYPGTAISANRSARGTTVGTDEILLIRQERLLYYMDHSDPSSIAYWRKRLADLKPSIQWSP